MTASGKKKQLRRDAVTAGDSYKDPAHDFLLPTASIPIEWVLHLGSFVSAGSMCRDQAKRSHVSWGLCSALSPYEPSPQKKAAAVCRVLLWAPVRHTHKLASPSSWRGSIPRPPRPHACARQACHPVAGMAPPAAALWGFGPQSWPPPQRLWALQ